MILTEVSAVHHLLEVVDITPLAREAWEARRAAEGGMAGRPGYRYLLDHPLYGLGSAMLYIYVYGRKPDGWETSRRSLTTAEQRGTSLLASRPGGG